MFRLKQGKNGKKSSVGNNTKRKQHPTTKKSTKTPSKTPSRSLSTLTDVTTTPTTAAIPTSTNNQTLRQRGNVWIKQHSTSSSSFPSEPPATTAAKYESRHVEMIAEALRDNGTDTPWEHQRGTFAHPALPLFLTFPGSEETKYQYSTTTSPDKQLKHHTLKSFNHTGSENDPDTPLDVGYHNFVSLGGRLIWGDPISVHNQTLTLTNYPMTGSNGPKMTNLNIQSSDQQQQQLNNPSTNELTPHHSDFILYKNGTAITSRDTTKMLAFREEYNAFFPSITNPDEPIVELNGDGKGVVKTSTNAILSTQLANPTTQVHQIRRELKQSYEELKSEMFTVNKPVLTNLSSKQQAGYLFSSLGNILKRRFKKDLQYDWKWTDQVVSLETIDLFNKSINDNNNKLYTDLEYAKQQGFNSTIVSPHFFALFMMDCLGTVSQDTAPARPGLWLNFEQRILEVQKAKAKATYAKHKQLAKQQLKKLELEEQEQQEQQKSSTIQDHHTPIDSIPDDSGNIKTKVVLEDEELEAAAENSESTDNNNINDSTTLSPTDTSNDQSHPANSSSTNPNIKQRLLRENTQQLDNADLKNLLKQKLQVQPWHTIYQQLSQFEYTQRVPFPAPLPITTSTTTTTTSTTDKSTNNDQSDSQPTTTTTTVTKKQDIIFDVYAKVMTEHELLRRKAYHQKIRNKLLSAEQKHLERRNQLENATLNNNNNTTTSTTTTANGVQIPVMPLIDGEVDPESTIFMEDLIRSGEMKVKIWIEGKPTITTTITTTTQWPKTKVPDIDDDDNTEDDLDVFNTTKRQGRELKKAQKVAEEMKRKQQMEHAQEALRKATIMNSDGSVDDNSNPPPLNQNISMEDEFQYPTTSFHISNSPNDLVTLNAATAANNQQQHHDPHDSQWHSTDTPVITESVEQVHFTLETTKQQFHQGTIYCEGMATFSTPILSVCGLNKEELDHILVEMQDRVM